jgi:4-amino-4-deoxy-L-arabinose transferase-like glycosyltransferase
VALALTLPPLAASSVLMTIDAPYAALWCWALAAGHRAVFRRSNWAWGVLGVLVGLGILAKYNMVLFLPSLGIFLLTTREYRGDLRRLGFWMACVAAGLLGGLPILVWNYQNDWVSFRHVNSLASGMKTHANFHPLGPLVYLGGQFALLLGFWFVAWVSAMIACRPGKEQDPGVRYLWWQSLPMFAVFLAFSFKTGGGELNWPATAYLSGLILAVAWWQRQLAAPSRWYRRFSAGSLAAACVLGLVLQVGAHRPDWFRPALTALAGEPTAARPFPLRRVDPTVRLRGWRFLAAEVDRERVRLQEQGIDPVLAGAHWTLPGELGFYCAGQPQVYSIGRVQGDRHSQYDLWRPNPLDDPEAFRGRSFLMVGGVGPEILAAFGRIEPVREIIYRESGQPVASWTIVIAHDFRGFPRKKREAGY